MTYIFSDNGQNPESAIVEVSRTTMDTLAGRIVTIEYRDVYAVLVGASPMWLIWAP